MEYIKRYVDKYLKNREDSKFSIVITGVRGCGKTESVLQFAKSKFIVDDKSNTKMTLETNPNVVLEGEKPRLIDEWQLQPWIWDKVRKPLSLNIITSDGFAYTRKEDGINVIPLCHLRGDLIE